MPGNKEHTAKQSTGHYPVFFFNNTDLAKMYYMRSRKIKICTFNLISDTLFMKSQLMLYGLMNPQSPKAALNSENSDKQYRNICRNRQNLPAGTMHNHLWPSHNSFRTPAAFYLMFNQSSYGGTRPLSTLGSGSGRSGRSSGNRVVTPVVLQSTPGERPQ